MSIQVKKHLELLGLPVKDRITGFSGTVTSIGFDLYGCIQATVHPGIALDGKMGESFWFDIARLEVLSTTPVMKRPNFDVGPVAEGDHGPAEKPKQWKS